MRILVSDDANSPAMKKEWLKKRKTKKTRESRRKKEETR
jgi:hypothetical protein